jgi:hypothetical protein
MLNNRIQYARSTEVLSTYGLQTLSMDPRLRGGDVLAERAEIRR